MRFVPGSHRGPLRAHTETREAHSMLARGQTVSDGVEENAAVDVVLEPGQLSLYHARMVHGSRPNRSGQRRYGVALRYMASHVRQVRRRGDSALLVRGVDSCGHFEPDRVPERDWEPWALALSAEVHAFASGAPVR